MVGIKNNSGNRLSETQINAQNSATITGDQSNPVAVNFNNGKSAVFYENPWVLNNADIDIQGTYINTATGIPTGNVIGKPGIGYTGDQDYYPAVALLNNGGDPSIPNDRALVVWERDLSGGGKGIYGQLADSNGQALTSMPFPLSGDLNDVLPGVAGLAHGGAAIVYENAATGEVKAEVTNTTGSSVASSAITVGTSYNASDPNSKPAVAALTNDTYVVAWVGTDVSGTGLHAKILDRAGNQIGNELGGGSVSLNEITQGAQDQVAVTGLNNGNFVVAWRDNSQLGGPGETTADTSGTAIKARIFNASGIPLSREMTVDTASAGDQSQPSVTAGPNGGFVVGWTDNSHQPDASGLSDQDGSAIKAQAFDANGSKIGGEILVNSLTASNQSAVNLSTAPDGSILAVFRDGSHQVVSGSTQTPDSSGTGIQSVSLSVDTGNTTTPANPPVTTPVTPPVTTPVTPTDTTPPALTFNRAVKFTSPTNVTLSGSVSDTGSGVKSVQVKEGMQTLGNATLAADGTWSFSTDLSPDYHTGFSAVATDNAGNPSSASSNFDLVTGVRGEPYRALQYFYTPDGSYGYTEFSSNGTVLVQADDNGDNSHTITGFANGQTLTSINNDMMTGGGYRETFHFDPHFGHAEITDFLLGGRGHDNLDLSNTRFSSLSQVLASTTMDNGSAVIHINAQDSITLDGVNKAQLRNHPADFALAG